MEKCSGEVTDPRDLTGMCSISYIKLVGYADCTAVVKSISLLKLGPQKLERLLSTRTD